MSLKKAIKQAINTTSSKWVATKVCGFTTQTNGIPETTMTIEVQVKKRKGKLKTSADDVLRKVYALSKYDVNHDNIMYNYQELHRMVAKYLRSNGGIKFYGKACS